jgi:hypothetical protein
MAAYAPDWMGHTHPHGHASLYGRQVARAKILLGVSRLTQMAVMLSAGARFAIIQTTGLTWRLAGMTCNAQTHRQELKPSGKTPHEHQPPGRFTRPQ